MSGNSGRSKLPGKQEVLIAALLTEATHAKAARKAKVSQATLQRWLQLPEFQAAYRLARRAVVEAAIGRLQQFTNDAVDALQRNLTCGQPANEIRAAATLLELSNKGVEHLDLFARIQELEALLASSSWCDAVALVVTVSNLNIP